MPITNWSNRLLAVLFLMVLVLPLVTRVLPGLEPQWNVVENRALVERPAFGDSTVQAFPAAYEAYYNDHFGCRDYLIGLNNLARYKLFNLSGTDVVVTGREGWLYYTGGSQLAGMPIENHRGDLAPFPENIFRRVRKRLEFTRDAFAAQGIDYLLVIAPDKWSIYPEYLPDTYQTDGAETGVEQLVHFLRATTTLEILDLRDTLQEAKGQQWPVYLKGDTHWSDLGAFHAANEILGALGPHFPAIKQLDAADYEFTTVEAPGAGLVDMLGLQGHLREQTFRITPHQPTGVFLSADSPPRPVPMYSSQDNPELPRAILLRDSFGTAVAPFLATGFEHLEFVWTSKAKGTGLRETLQAVQPDVIIEMRVERFMLHASKYYRIHNDEFAGEPE